MRNFRKLYNNLAPHKDQKSKAISKIRGTNEENQLSSLKHDENKEQSHIVTVKFDDTANQNKEYCEKVYEFAQKTGDNSEEK